MYKTIGVAALLCAVAFVTSGSSASPNIAYPHIVGQLNRTASAPIATTTLFTAPSTGLYRISAYFAMTTPGTTGFPWNFDVSWTDAAGPEGPLQLLQVSDKQISPNSYSFGPTAGYQQTLILYAIAGTEVSYTVNDGGSHPGGTYQISATAEHIQ